MRTGRPILTAILLILPLVAQATVKDPKAAAAGPGTTWFPQIEKSLDVDAGQDEAYCIYPFQNPTDAAVEWRELTGSCTCSSAMIRVADRVYAMVPKPKQLLQVVTSTTGEQRVPVTAIPIGPHEHGEVEVHVQVHGHFGPKVVTVDIHSTDPIMPMTKLKLTANAPLAIIVQPSEVELGIVVPSKPREFTATVTSPVQKDFEIIGSDPFPPNMTATYDKVMRDGAAVWTIHGTFEGRDQKAIGGTMRFLTNIAFAKSFTLNVRGTVKMPVEVVPGFVTLGSIHAGSKAVGRFRIQPNDASKIAVLALRLEKLSLPAAFVSVTHRMDGDSIVVEVEVAANAPLGLVRGDVVVEIDHPTEKERRVLFNGFVR